VEEKSIFIAYRGTEEFRKRLKIAAAERGVSVQDLLDRLVEEYVFKPDAPPLPPAPEFTPQDAALAKDFLAWLKKTRAQPHLRHVAEMVIKLINDE